MSVAHHYLFNFAASPVGGGLKRLCEYARWFDDNGGAYFIIHPEVERLTDEFTANQFFVLAQSPARRMLGEFSGVLSIRDKIGTPLCYYSYGIPLYERVGRLNWFHLSNVLPLAWRTLSMPLGDRLKFAILGYRLTHHLGDADVISAESQASLARIDR